MVSGKFFNGLMRDLKLTNKKMKKLLFLILISTSLLSCKKDKTGTIQYQLKFDCANQVNRISEFKSTTADSVYTQFGDFIGSITPTEFEAKFNFLFVQSSKYVVSFVNGEHTDPSTGQPYLMADFSNNQQITMEPNIHNWEVDDNGNPVNPTTNEYEDDEISFSFLSFTARYFYQRFELPVEYTGVDIQQLLNPNGFPEELPVRNGNDLKVWSAHLFYPLNYSGNDLYCIRYNFGVFPPGADSFYLHDTSAVIIHGTFTPVTLTMPAADETTTLYSTISFDTENLLHLYAGSDNIPYTSDDIIVYAPDFWNRVKVTVEIR